jgi:hypothetical protein
MKKKGRRKDKCVINTESSHGTVTSSLIMQQAATESSDFAFKTSFYQMTDEVQIRVPFTD